jgi:hypothetical protein
MLNNYCFFAKMGVDKVFRILQDLFCVSCVSTRAD